jgi:hypothetical protein
MSTSALQQREALRQQQLLRTLWRRGDDSALALWLRESGARAEQGVAAYRSNAAAIAERSLAAAFPTLQQLLGDESFAQLARVFWLQRPPQRGDLAWFGDGLPAWIEADAQLASEPYLADVARVDWAVHAIEQAADVAQPPAGLALLGELDPSRLLLRLRPGLVLQRSPWPVATIWQAHRRDDAERFAPVREAFARGDGELALIARSDWRAQVEALDEGTFTFMSHVQRGDDLAHALENSGDAWAFDHWLQRALTQQWLQGIRPVDDEAAGGHP